MSQPSTSPGFAKPVFGAISIGLLCAAAAVAGSGQEPGQALGMVEKFEKEVVSAKGALGNHTDVTPPHVVHWIPQRAWKVVKPGRWRDSVDMMTFSAYRVREDRAVMLALVQFDKGPEEGALYSLLNSSTYCDLTLPGPAGGADAVVRRGRAKLMRTHTDQYGWYSHMNMLLYCMLDTEPKSTEPSAAPDAGPPPRASLELLKEASKGEPGRDASLPPLGLLRISVWDGALTLLASLEGESLQPATTAEPMKEFLIYCGPPMYGFVPVKSLAQWVIYHQFHLGFERLVFYDSGAVGKDIRTAFASMLESGTMEFIPYAEESPYPSYWHAQLVANHDCMWRNRDVATWISYGDLDEYVHVVDLPHHVSSSPDRVKGFTSLRQFLRLEGHRFAGITRGSYSFLVECDAPMWSIQTPRAGGFRFAVEKLLMRENRTSCYSSQEVSEGVCLNGPGVRKLIVNPRKVPKMIAGNHCLDLDDFEESARDAYLTTMDLPVWFIYDGHYRGMYLTDFKECNETRNFPRSIVYQPVFYAGIAMVAARAREFACSSPDYELKHTIPCHLSL